LETKKKATTKKQIDPEEYEKIKQERLRADQDAQKNKKVVKADTELKKKIVREEIIDFVDENDSLPSIDSKDINEALLANLYVHYFGKRITAIRLALQLLENQ